MAWTLATFSKGGPYLSSGGCQGACRGLVTINDDDSYTFTVDYYMMAQFSRYIPGGARILSGNGSFRFPDDTGLQSVASLNPDGTRTVVIMNNFANDIYLTLSTKSGEEWSGNIPERSVVTWILPAIGWKTEL